MVTDADIVRLREVYERLQSLEVVFEYGPLRAYADSALVQDLWRTTIDPAVKLVQDCSRKVADGTYEADAPSPWHAYFYLRAQHQYVYRSGRPLHAPGNPLGPPVGEHMFFRGQSCADWPFRSSLRRKDEAARAIARRAVAALAEYFRSHFTTSGDIPANTALCFAQHYGIATDLTDISCDPDTAVWFATHSVGKACPSCTPNAVVRAVTWAGQARGAPTRVLLPPPFVRNVYTQRGLFVDTSGTYGVMTGGLVLDVRFPRETAGGVFRVIRDGNPVDVWPDPDEHERELVAWALDVAAATRTDDDACRLVVEHRAANRLPKFWLERELYDFAGIVAPWLSIFDWVLPATCVTALPVSGAAIPMRYEVLGLKVRELVRANRTLFDAFVKSAEGADFTGFEVLHQVTAIACEELADGGEGGRA